MLLKIILLSLFSSAYADCDRCLDITQNLKNSPRTLHGIFRFLHVFCFFGDRQNCNNYLDETYNYITDTSNNNICYDLGYCPDLYGENIYMNTYYFNKWTPQNWINYNITIFKNNNNLLGYNSSFYNNNLNYNLAWNITINDTIKSINLITFGNSNPATVVKIPNRTTNCYFKNNIYYILTVQTQNNNYYYNYTNVPNFIGNISIINNIKNILPRTWPQRTNINFPSYDIPYNNLFFINQLRNRNNYKIIFSRWSEFKLYSCDDSGIYMDCCTSEIVGLGEINHNINFM